MFVVEAMQFPELRQLTKEQEEEVLTLLSLKVSSSRIAKLIEGKHGICLTDYDVRNRKKTMMSANGATEEIKINKFCYKRYDDLIFLKVLIQWFIFFLNSAA